MKKIFSAITALITFGSLIWFVGWIFQKILSQFVALPQTLAVALITASTTIIVSTLTIMAGRYFERKRELEALYRDKKIVIYDEFLKEFFDIFNSEEEGKSEKEVVAYLREWQRKIILWGGKDVLTAYSVWQKTLKEHEPNAQTVFRTEDLMLSIRKDLGHNNNGIPRGTFIRFILQQADLFLEMAKKDPNVSLNDLAEMEKRLNLQRKR